MEPCNVWIENGYTRALHNALDLLAGISFLVTPNAYVNKTCFVVKWRHTGQTYWENTNSEGNGIDDYQVYMWDK